MENEEITQDYVEFIQVVRNFIRQNHLTIIWDRYYKQTDLYKKSRHQFVIKHLESLND